ncbi:zinc ribbon domain-containing protein [Lactiplantibacillus pentosus]|uniref:zinc ribbon domain-containing protein n=1 Tax=Lactiplantibacillus pentosus TaxID=1589 RepID=UPI001C1E9E54|nr:zinc ribbon domain-containing protein [Lactiplantibacillus pentosus]MBU7494943.1 DUF4767 domain-containing protein [Lactiplantibacillus pentosus]MBU7520952.1 DUF4767 domain-containing protein [Lactiplantibacillus pentosus]
MYCPNCGKKNDLDALFCENCGARLILPTSSSSAASSATTRATSENAASCADTHSASDVDDHTTRAAQSDAAAGANRTTRSAQSDSATGTDNTSDDTDDTVAPTTRSAQHAQQQGPRSPHPGLPALILALIVIVLVGGGYYWFSHNSANTNSNTTATSSSSTATKSSSSSSSAASTQSSSSSTTKTAAKWSTAKMSELSSFMSTWQDTMNQSYAGTYDGQSVSVDGLDLPTDIRDNNYQDKITVNGNAVKLTWTTKANTDANYQVVAAAAYQHGTQVIVYLYVFHNGSPDVLVSQDTNTTYNLTSSANTDLQNGFAKIANAD